MDSKFELLISTGPLDQDWLVAEIYYDGELLCELREWGEKLVIYPRQNGDPWKVDVEEFIESVKTAEERVRFIPDQE